MCRYIPNILTTIRILCSVALLACHPLSHVFIWLYVAAGISDILDGMVARHFDAVSSFGEKYDSMADFIFVGVCLVKLIPIFKLPLWGIMWIALIAGIKGINLMRSHILRRNKLFLHTIANKVTGAVLFLTPLALVWIPMYYVLPIICSVATFAAIQEGYILQKGDCMENISTSIKEKVERN